MVLVAPNTKRIVGYGIATVVFAAAIAGYYYFKLSGPSARDSDTPVVDTSAKSSDIEKSLETDDQGLSHLVVVVQTTRGKIRFKFYSKDAPKTVHRMVELIQKGFYNGLIFHRVVPGFVIQGGDPSGTGMGGSGVKLPAEFNSRKHIPGAVAMARSADPNSADSQFYITLGTPSHLDGQYTIFGQLIEGQDVANQIQPGDRMTTISFEK